MSQKPARTMDDLEVAYRRTDYRVADRGWSFVLRIDQESSVLASCHDAFGVTCSAYVTAWNPRSEPFSADLNEAAQRRLETELAAAGLAFLRGEGVDPSGVWPGEPSLLVLGMTSADAAQLAGTYGQNAIVVAGRDAVARLVML